MADADQNPVGRRVAYLSGRWEAFAATPARVLRWVAAPDARQLVDIFLEVHMNDPAGIPDLFLRFEVPFRDETSYAADVLRFWKGWFDENKAGLLDETIDPTWQMPKPRAGEPGYALLARVCTSFHLFYGADVRNLAVALVPSEVRDPAGWGRWLHGLARVDSGVAPPVVRFLVTDDPAAPVLKPVADANPGRVHTQVLEVDGNMMYRELLAEAGGSGPGAAFRDQYCGMLLAARVGSYAAAAAAGVAAVAVAGAEGWSHLAAAAQIGVAGVLAASGKPAEALAGYRQATKFAEAAATAGEATGPLLVVQSRMAEGGALFAGGQFADAAAVYEDAAPKATALGDHLLAMENWRMAAACHDQTGDSKRSWECGQKALAAGAEIDPEMRPNTTLPFAGQGLLKLTKQKAFAGHRERLVETMTALVGPGWEDRRP